MKVLINRLHPGAILPEQQTKSSSGFDLYALDVVSPGNVSDPYNDSFETIELRPGQRVLVRTGIAIQVPSTMEAQVRPRSGLALKHGLTVLNSPGTIDADYTGDIGVILINLGDKPVDISKGDRVAQLVFKYVHHEIEFLQVKRLSFTQRSNGGFGHTGRG
ncbi:dUTP diphosphatase [Heliophilum fasciatum]|uniref:Deoxyuridine 5'-triphosphate nucleotidohydrolase n=1 Tax=Heliophilum fasciatum TaxID=35700 RepID=A0A4V2SWJ9_9FIRM|nr:dUTP diphosphatase [Heliophilum fasciatum]MCW2278704.1 dUTP pyrophosphatase [Heliophilum fasciatum]TCP62556.1 dUTP pyrophosphatase [Heliophilum fasciatum]